MDVELFEVISVVVTSVVLPLLGWGARKLGQFLDAKIENEYVSNAQSRLWDALSTAVTAVGKEFVEQAKDTNADGKLSKAEAAHAKNMAVAKLKTYLGPKGLKELAFVLGAEGLVDEFLADKVEAEVQASKSLEKRLSSLPK